MRRKKGYKQMVAEETLIFDATEEIARVMNERGLTQRQLADLLGKSESRVSRLLGGRENVTLRSIANVATVLGFKFEIKLVPDSGPR